MGRLLVCYILWRVRLQTRRYGTFTLDRAEAWTDDMVISANDEPSGGNELSTFKSNKNMIVWQQ